MCKAKLNIRLLKHPHESCREFQQVYQRYYESFSVFPTPPEFLWVVENGNMIKGTIGVSISHGELLGVKSPYELLSIDIPYRAVEIGRWTSVSSEVSTLLISTALSFVLQSGHTHVVCEQSKSVHRLSLRLGITFTHLSSTLRIEHIPEAYMNYYIREQPSLYVFEAYQAYDAITEYRQRCGYT